MTYGEPVIPASVHATHECVSCHAQYAEKVDFCLRCYEHGVIYPKAWRPITEDIPNSKPMTAHALAAEDQRRSFPTTFPKFALTKPCVVCLYGPPGNGKTTMLLRMAEGLLPVEFFSLEEGAGPTLADKLRRLEIRTYDLMIYERPTIRQIMDAASKSKTIAIDSFSLLSLTPRDVLDMCKGYGCTIIGTLQVRKDGLPAGSNEWLHLPDVVAEVKNLKWRMTKSRCGELEKGDVL